MSHQRTVVLLSPGLRITHALLLVAAAGWIFVAMGHGGGFLAQVVVAGPAWAVLMGAALIVSLMAAAVMGKKSFGVASGVFVLATLCVAVVAASRAGVNTFTLLTMIPFALVAVLIVPHMWLIRERPLVTKGARPRR